MFYSVFNDTYERKEGIFLCKNRVLGRSGGVLLGTAPTVHAAGISAGQTALTVNTSVVAFAGHEWWVIGKNDGVTQSGVYTDNTNSVTLFAKNLDEEFKEKPFRKQDKNGQKYRYYLGDREFSLVLEKNPSGMAEWKTPNEYAGSTLQRTLEGIAGNFPSKERSVILERTLAADATADNNQWVKEKNEQEYKDGMAGPGIANQMLWPLSSEEWEKIKNTPVVRYGAEYFLRSTDSEAGYAAKEAGRYDGSTHYDMVYYAYDAARPALNLDLQNVIFTSSAEGGKPADIGSSLVDASVPSSTVKFTMKDTSQTLTLEATEAQKTQSDKSSLEFIYAGATYGTDQYISCVLTDNAADVKYYGKLKQVDSADKANGTMQIPLAGVGNGAYTLKIFSEQANGAKSTDFASEPITMTVTVSDGKGSVTNYGGNSHTHKYQYTKLNDTQHQGVCYCTEKQTGNHNWSNGECSDCTYQCEHTGGKATCKAQATCTTCLSSYGEIDPNAHTWGSVTYTWAADGSSCTAEGICNSDNNHKGAAKAAISKAVTKKATCKELGETTYTASFTETWAQSNPAQTKTIADIPITGHSYAGGKCTVCGAPDPNHRASSGSVSYATLTFDTNGGSSLANVSQAYGTTVDLKDYVSSYKGYAFAGWYSDEGLTNKITSIRLDGDKTVYAGWLRQGKVIVPKTGDDSDILLFTGLLLAAAAAAGALALRLHRQRRGDGE